MYTCLFHHVEIQRGQECQQCLDDYPNLPHPNNMTGEERVAELDRWDVCSIAFPLLHRRINALVGRPVFTQEMSTLKWHLLREEARTHDHPHPSHVIQSLNEPGVIIIPVVIEDDPA